MRKESGWHHWLPLLAAAVLLGCTKEPTFDPQRAYRDVVKQCELGPRLPGSEASRQAGDYIAAQLRAAGWAVDVESFCYRGVDLRNVIATKGQGPVVLLGAHYDTRALASRDGEKPTAPVPGANDGASGVAVLLELGRTLDAQRLRNEVWLVFFDAEDQAYIDQWPWSVGARQVAASLTARPEFVVVVDMVGDAEQQLYYEHSSTAELNKRIWSLAADLGYGRYFLPSVKHSLIDDHTPFLEQGIPAVDIIDFDYPYWHTTADTADKVSAASLGRVGRVLERLLEGSD